VTINEFLPNPSGSDSVVELEWVELVNTSVNTVDLSGWSLERATTPGAWVTIFTVPDTTTIAPGGFLVIGEQNVTDADLIMNSLLNLGNASTTGDALRLVDHTGGFVDTVIYGPNNSDGFLDDTGVVAASVAAGPLADQSVARVIDGVDSDDSGADFLITSEPTMGASNNPAPEPEPPLLLATGWQSTGGGTSLQLTWTNNGSQYVVQGAGSVTGSWSTVFTPWTTNAGWISTFITNSSPAQFYRLAKN
jgi:hypothetical protein